MRRILYLTGTRADFGLMEATLRAIDAHPGLQLQLAVTGMHLSAQFGATVDEIEASGLPIAARIPTDVDSRTPAGMARAVGQTVLGMTQALEQREPDVLLLLGDRGEMLGGAIAALHLGVVIAHLHGGERSGTVDEPVRHAISKLAHWHFAATEASRERLVRMGEAEDHVWVTGAPSLDGLVALGDRPRREVLQSLGLGDEERYLLVLFHPVVQEEADAYAQTQALAAALRETAGGRRIVWLAPNADAGSAGVLQGRADAGEAGIRAITHLPRAAYVAALRHADLLVGNSSSGIIEAASFGTPVVNIGLRQNARERNANTIDCGTGREEIASALRSASAHGPYPPANVYGDGAAAARIVRLLADTPITPALLHKVNRY
ncbi:UDP-N-acetylglucosamine 2-epimerase (hydrolyzing) [Ramlibacter terrae]|uniref:UDP-N-acetylglucosamine 2-epimerase (Hydrolyzing) n=1 Tax=Ramlibacter terrae TaxID=2732511 RepID=A0ABX6P7U4_9BURK|nr:UDP-N-acetylglucosamine 2-epimerase (hydrolyzing) [Ramlibacter terrae]